jgi:glycosyltransferase involved in cell wall biosynthesis
MIVNGRFLQQRLTGVQRFAREMVGALDDLLEGGAHGCTLMTPAPGTDQRYRNIAVRAVGRLSGQGWEQLELPRFAGREFLLNLGNAAPLLHRRQAVVLHDAGVYAVAGSYKPLYRRWALLQHRAFIAAGVKIFTVSEFSRRELAHHLRLAPERIDVLGEGCDHMLRVAADNRIIDRLRLSQHAFCLTVGSLAPHKNFAALATTAARLDGMGARLVIVGQPDDRLFSGGVAMPQRAITFTGAVTDGELRALYERAAVFVFPSIYEGFGLPPLEAMICGCPVVVARAGSLPEVCADAALYADAGDGDDIANQVVGIMHSTELTSALRRRGRSRAALFTWRTAAERLLTAVDRCSA